MTTLQDILEQKIYDLNEQSGGVGGGRTRGKYVEQAKALVVEAVRDYVAQHEAVTKTDIKEAIIALQSDCVFPAMSHNRFYERNNNPALYDPHTFDVDRKGNQIYFSKKKVTVSETA